MGLIAGTRVWDELRDLITAAVHRWAAVAYAGRQAAELLPLSSGDSVVVGGSAAALKAGSTYPDAVAAWITADAQVSSLRSLHAMVIVLGDSAYTTTAVIGSATASEHTNNDLLEAVVVTDEPTVCEVLGEQLDLWIGLADRLGEGWLRRARTVRLAAASELGALSLRTGRPDPAAYRLAFDRLHLTSGRHLVRDDQRPVVATQASIGPDAAACQLSCGDVGVAVAAPEHGRAVSWAHVLHGRSDLSGLVGVDPGLAARLAEAQAAIVALDPAEVEL